MRPDQWTVDGYHPLIVCLAAIWLLWQTYEAVHDTRLAVRTMWRKRHKTLTSRAPAAAGMRQSQRLTPTAQGPAMPNEDEVTRIGHGPGWTPSAGVPTQGFPTPENRRPDRSGIVVGGLALLGTLLAAALAGGGYVAYQKLSASAGTFNARGWLELRDATDGVPAYEVDGFQCAGVGGFSDVAEGAAVTVRDASGKTVAVGKLGQGLPGGDGCEFTLAVLGIPEGSRFYSFEVTHRGQVTVTRADARAPRLTLG